MSKRIRVIPEQLIKTSVQMDELNNELRQVIGDLGSVLHGISEPGYEGQFIPKVAARVGQAQNAAATPSNKLAELAAELTRRANLFLAADQAAQAGVNAMRLGISELNENSKVVEQWAKLLGIPADRIRALLALGFLTGTYPFPLSLTMFTLAAPITGMFWWGGKTFLGVLSSLPAFSSILSSPKNLYALSGNTSQADFSFTFYRDPKMSGVVSSVPVGGRGSNYWRTADGRTMFSNCTYYVGAYLKYVSGGKIDILTPRVQMTEDENKEFEAWKNTHQDELRNLNDSQLKDKFFLEEKGRFPAPFGDAKNWNKVSYLDENGYVRHGLRYYWEESKKPDSPYKNIPLDDINRIPKAGATAQFAYGHVAQVEEVIYDREAGTVKMKLSEENWEQGPIVNHNIPNPHYSDKNDPNYIADPKDKRHKELYRMIEVPDGKGNIALRSERWVQYKTLPYIPVVAGNEVEFFHWKYPKVLVSIVSDLTSSQVTGSSALPSSRH